MSTPEHSALPTLPGQDVVSDRFVDEVVMAAIDVLGIKQLMIEDGDCGRAIEAFQLFVLNAAGVANGERELVHYGDVVYILADPTLSVSAQAARLQGVCAELLALALAVPPERTALRLRAGIARGNLHFREVDCMDSRYELMMGTAMTHALELERSQEWVGCAIERELVTADSSLIRPEYAVPLKAGADAGILAVDWVTPAIAHFGHDTVSGWATGFETGGAAPAEVARKLGNTAAFMRAMLARA